MELLTTGRLGGAGLDVFVDEPNVPAALFDLDNVVLFPHIGSATARTRKAMALLTIRNLDRYFATRQLVTPVLRIMLKKHLTVQGTGSLTVPCPRLPL